MKRLSTLLPSNVVTTGPVTLRRLLHLVTVAYIISSLPLVILFLRNLHFRNTFLDMATHYFAKIRNVETVHVGDSIMAGGGHWSSRLFGLPFNSINLAGNGYTVAQTRGQVLKGLSYNPETIFVLAGTNDIVDPIKFDLNTTMEQYDALLADIKQAGVNCVVTLIPYQSHTVWRDRINQMNSRLTNLAASHNCGVIDLNPHLAPKQVLLPHYTSDGTHFTEPALKIWTNHKADLLSSPAPSTTTP